MRDNNLHDLMAFAFLESMRWNRDQLTVLFNYTIPKSLQEKIKIGGLMTMADIPATVTRIEAGVQFKLILNKQNELLEKVDWTEQNEIALIARCDALREDGHEVGEIVDGVSITVQFGGPEFINSIKNKSSRLMDEAKRAWNAYTLLKKYNMDEFFAIPRVSYHEEPGVHQ